MYWYVPDIGTYQYTPVLGMYQYIPGMVRTGTYRYLVRTGMYLELVYTGIHLTWYVPVRTRYRYVLVRTNSRYVPVSATVSGHLELPVGVTSQSMMVVDGMWYSVEWCGQNRCCSRELYRYSLLFPIIVRSNQHNYATALN